ncbi:MAG: SRPBCC family protein, partial [Candidatus Binatia bacterium]
MAIGIATGFLILLVIYFIWQTAQNQDLELEYSLYYSPRETVVETQLNVGAPPNEIWDVLTDLADYHHWFPWIRRVHVTNPGADRWVHRHSIDHFPVEVGTRFKIRPFLFSPLTGCRFITVDPPNILSMEMRLFPLNREFVSFSLKPFKRHVEVTYRATRR